MARINKLGTPYLGLPTLSDEEIAETKAYIKDKGISAKELLVYLLRRHLKSLRDAS